MGQLSDENWVSCKDGTYPTCAKLIFNLEILPVYYEPVLVQTERGEILVAVCEKYRYYDKRKNKTKWYLYGTGGRRIRVMSKVVAWMELPEKYKGE